MSDIDVFSVDVIFRVWYKPYHMNRKGVSMFGELLKARRVELGLSLREFCRRLNEDPSNWSKVERGITRPPQQTEKLRHIASIINIEEGSEDWDRLVDAAVIDAGEIPDYIMGDKEVLNSLPAFFRTIGNVKPTADEIRQLITKLKESDST